jgi:flagellar basal body P-ring protein FlgI
MRRTSSMTILATVICLVCATAAEAQEAAVQKEAPAAVAKSAPAKSTSAVPASKEPTRVKVAGGADLVQVLAKMRQEAKGDRLTVGDVCEVKHYKQDTLQGFGLVLDLEEIASPTESETGEEETAAATAARLTELLALLNTPVGTAEAAPTVPEQFRDAGQVTLVAVTATIPPEGVQKGDRIDCEVRAIGGQSLANGYLFVTQLSVPGPRKDAPAALAAGPTVTQSSVRSGPAKVLGGCVAETAIGDQFVKEEKICLMLGEDHAEFPIAQDVVDLINTEMEVAAGEPLAKALNRHSVEVTVPEQSADDPVAFITKILRLETDIPAPDDRR